MRKRLLICLLVVGLLSAPAAGEEVDYQRDVLPILAANCFACHGPDEAARQGELRLDDLSGLATERSIVVAGRPDASELIQRVESTDEELRMPPKESGEGLSTAQIETLKQWVAQGAASEKHWAFAARQEQTLDGALAAAGQASHPIDAFIAARLAKEGLSPAPEAEREVLLRRVSLDLTGLPPTPDEVDAFLADDSPTAYDRVVDRLLASPRTGERLALDWLDAARYADSGGYQGDLFRTMWPWRDWAIEAFNRNMPFDEFTVYQIAGDLLRDGSAAGDGIAGGPTREQQIASGFHRNHRINDEEGIVLEEFRVEYVVDRVETTAAIWLGLTLGCCRCHDHKYDPISQREFYSLYAFFNNIAEEGKGNGSAPPVLRLTTLEQDRQAAEIEKEIAALQEELAALAESEETKPRREELAAQIAAATARREAAVASAPLMMVQKELATPRETFILVRGAYDKPGEKVTAGVPAVLPPLPADAAPNRLSLAKWLVDPANPLPSRAIVNRYWQMLFGVGIVSTPEDFGVRGERPSHPELLDWLAGDFIASGWDVKRLLKRIVTSGVYRQSSRATAELYERDPENRLQARGPRFRLPAELLRDQSLAASGLLVEKSGGPPVRPYQPEGLWKELASNELEYGQSHGADLYRRGLYTFWRRTIAPPAMAAFDAPSREICTVRRPRTNTPLQALVLMNDPTFVEASRGLAERALKESGATPEERVERMFRLVMARRPSVAERDVLLDVRRHFRDRYAANPDDALKLTTVGESAVAEGIDKVELAAWTAVAATVLNLDEAVTKE